MMMTNPVWRILFFAFAFVCMSLHLNAETVPVLEFPEAGMDDPARYRNYTTRFYRDPGGNSFQIYIDNNSGRVVNLWADSINASTSFSVRDSSGQPVAVKWKSAGANTYNEKGVRVVEYTLEVPATSAQIGHFLLGSMRKERDFQYFKMHLRPFESEPFQEDELKEMISNLKDLPENIRNDHLQILKAAGIEELEQRLDPEPAPLKMNQISGMRFEQISFDGRNHLTLELKANGTFDVKKRKVNITSTEPIVLFAKVTTDAAALSPLNRKEIFNTEFFKFYESVEKTRQKEFRWLDREVRGLELLSSKEKLMAGLPNFATYFGRDTMMSSLMMEPIWSSAMLEHAISSVLNKLREDGAVSHEEALGGQAIRENAGEYNQLIQEYLKGKQDGPLQKAKTILRDLQKVRENYRMVDDDFQLPVLTARYLSRPDVSDNQKRAFLNRRSRTNVPFHELLVHNIQYVFSKAAAYVNKPVAENLVSFPLENQKWGAASWRDSNAGYAGGRFAMDVNAIWVPQALEGSGVILAEIEKLNVPKKTIQPDLNLPEAIKVWKQAWKHFRVVMKPEEAKARVDSKLQWLPEEERLFWQSVMKNYDPAKVQIDFLALSLDEKGNPIPIPNTDPATLIFLQDFSNDPASLPPLQSLVDNLLLEYPAGIFVHGLGPLAANDAYASPQIWENFKNDLYHSPRVVWGREVNLIILGLMKQIQARSGDSGEVKSDTLTEALSQTVSSVEASGLKHNELWTYRIENGKLMPVRYPTSTDIQLWNLTDLAVQFLSHKGGFTKQ